MKLWIVYSKIIIDPKKPTAFSWMLDEAHALGFDAEIIFSEDLIMETSDQLSLFHFNKKVTPPDVVFMRCYDLPLAYHFEAMNIPMFNKHASLQDCMDKFKTHQLLVKNHLPTPKTLFSIHPIPFETIKEQLGLPFITKDNTGSRGTQVFLVTDEITFKDALKACDQPLHQAYIESSFGKDIRAHVIGNQFITCLLRKSKGDFKSNFSQGGQALLYEADETLKQLAIDATKALKLDFAGIDILLDEKGYTICEVNGIPGFRTVGLTSKENIPRHMLTYIRRNI